MSVFNRFSAEWDSSFMRFTKMAFISVILLIIKNIIGNLNFENIIKYIDYHQANMKPLVLEPCNLEIMSTLTLRYEFNFRVENYLGKILLFTQEIKLRPTLRTNRFNVFQPNQIHIYFWHILNSNLNN